MAGEREEITPDKREVIRSILGLDAETFKRTKLGQYIYDAIEGQELLLIEELIEASSASSDIDMVRRGMDIQMRRMLPKLVDEAIQSGHQASNNIDRMNDQQHDY